MQPLHVVGRAILVTGEAIEAPTGWCIAIIANNLQTDARCDTGADATICRRRYMSWHHYTIDLGTRVIVIELRCSDEVKSGCDVETGGQA